MQVNDDTIRSAFAWPVRYDPSSELILDGKGSGIVLMVANDVVLHQLGETIAEMLNERYAPKGMRRKGEAMQTKDELISEMTHPYSEAEMDYALVICEKLYDRIAEVATREASIRCEEQEFVIIALINPPDKGVCNRCAYYAELRCLCDTDDRLKGASCADGVMAYIEARVKERMGG